MTINGMQKLTLLDYPGNVACLIFTVILDVLFATTAGYLI